MNFTEKKRNLTFSYALVQLFYWVNFAAVTGFTSIYLLHAGFSNTQIGILIAAAGVISSILQPILASYADRPSSPSLKKILITCSVIMFLLAAALLIFQSSLILTGFFYTAAITFQHILMPLINSLGMETLNQGKKLNYGAARGTGSASYAITAYILGIIVAMMREITIPVSILLGSLTLLLVLAAFPFQKSRRTTDDRKEKSSDGLVYFLRKYKRFSVTLFGCIFIYMSHILINNFAFQIVESKGGGSSEMGLAIALAAFSELPTLFLFGFMLKKVRVDIWFRLSGVFFLLKSLGSLLAPNIAVFYCIQVFQMFGWALMTVSSVYYVNSVMEEQDVIKGQAYMTMMYTLGSVLGSLIGGALIDAISVNAMLIFSSASALAGTVIVMVTASPRN